MKLTTLKKNREFSVVYHRGKSVAKKHLVLYFLPRRYGGLKVGFSVSKKIGKSVVRNKIRRQLKAAWQQLSVLNEQKSMHFIFIARAPIAQAEYREMEKEMEQLLLLAQKGQKGEKK